MIIMGTIRINKGMNFNDPSIRCFKPAPQWMKSHEPYLTLHLENAF